MNYGNIESMKGLNDYAKKRMAYYLFNIIQQHDGFNDVTNEIPLEFTINDLYTFMESISDKYQYSKWDNQYGFEYEDYYYFFGYASS